MSAHHVITVYTQAPAKPALGDACNGCGICCLSEPCPLGVLLSGKRQGPCSALIWSDAQRVYRCGALGAVPAAESPPQPGQRAQWPRLAALRAKLVARWIAAGCGCDCSLEALPSPTIGPSSQPNDAPPHD